MKSGSVQSKSMWAQDEELKTVQTEDIQAKDMQLQNADDGYLSDEELELLIADIEQNDLVAAPPDMAEDIWNIICTSIVENMSEVQGVSEVHGISEISNISEVQSISDVKGISNAKGLSKDRVREFRAYCFRVVTSVAAAVVLVFTVPSFMSGQEPGVIWNTESQMNQWQEKNNQNEELTQDSTAQQACESREECLGRSSLTEFLSRNSIFGSGGTFGNSIFSESDNRKQWNIFK